MDDGVAATLVDAVERLRPDIADAVSQAVRIESVAPRYPGENYDEVVGGEGRVARFMAGLYGDAGCEIDVFGLEEGRENCVALRRGSGKGRSLLFNGHVDVVPPGPAEQWRHGPWSGRVKDDCIFGRGACDMKGGLVAQAFAARAIHEANISLRGDLILTAVVGEEMMEHELGTTACVKRGYRADAAVVSEPSSPPIALAVLPITPGVMWFRISVEGKATHTSMRGETVRPGGYGSAVGVNAIDKAFLIYDALRQLEEEWAITKKHELFRPGHFAINPGVFVGAPTSGPVPFVVPDSAVLDYIVWYHPEQSAQDVRDEIEHHVSLAARLDSWLHNHPPTVEWVHHWGPSRLDPAHDIVREVAAAHQRAVGYPASIHGFAAVCDATFLNAAGIPAVIYGPGDLRNAHAVNEYVEIEELVSASKTYALLAAAWCGV